MFNWYNQDAPKNTITRYLSNRYSLAELENLTHLELPDHFERVDYANELTEILKDSPWKVSEVQYQTSSFSSLKGIFTKDYWFKPKNSVPEEEASETSSLNSEPSPSEESIYFDTENNGESNSLTNWTNIHYSFTFELQQQWESQGFTYEQTMDWINIGLTPQDADFCAWLEQAGYTALAVLNYEDLEQLRTEYQQSLVKKPLFDWYSEEKLTFTEFSLLSNQLGLQVSKDYSLHELKGLLTNYQLQEANYPLTKLILLLGGTGLILYLLTN